MVHQIPLSQRSFRLHIKVDNVTATYARVTGENC
jgi:hypothetical protein